MSKYRIVFLNSFGGNTVGHSNSWLYCKFCMFWLNLTGKKAVWMEKVDYHRNERKENGMY